MARLKRNGASIFVATAGERGDTVVLLHGSLSDHSSWDELMPLLARETRVIAYDRRGHSQSRAAAEQDSIFQDADDLAAVIEELAPGCAHVVGTSGGGAIALRLACRCPELILSVVAHEPPLLEELPDREPWIACKARLNAAFRRFVELVKEDESEGAARFFVDNLSDGAGAWDRLPTGRQNIFVRNALSLFYECHDPEFLKADFGGLSGFKQPVLFTQGGRSAPFFAEIIDTLIARALPDAQRHIYPEAGHSPHESHPQQCAQRLLSFIRNPHQNTPR